MKALITGSDGFCGKHLIELLQAKKITTVGFQDDLREKSNVVNQLKKIQPDWIFHLASPILRSDKLIDNYLADNLEVDLFGTVYLIEAAAELTRKPKILITNTAAVYAPSTQSVTESHSLKPLTSYGLSKLTQELVSRQLCQSYDIPLIITRTFLLIGPGQKPGFVVTDLAKSIAKGVNSITLGNPRIRRDFTDVRDACQAYYLLMKKGKPGEVYNVCSGTTVSIDDIAQRLISLSGREISIKIKTAWRSNDPPIVCGNNSKLRALGWQPKISLNQSLKDALNYWSKH
jgi:GDP-4-dehydro-6-deoxy-D-mannose reductase